MLEGQNSGFGCPCLTVLGPSSFDALDTDVSFFWLSIFELVYYSPLV